MGLEKQIKPISYLKANAAEVLLDLAESREPLVITQNGEAKAVLQDIASWERTQETLALLNILAPGERQVAEGKVRPIRQAIAEIRATPIPLPSLARQSVIAERLCARDLALRDARVAAHAQVADVEALPARLLAQAFDPDHCEDHLNMAGVRDGDHSEEMLEMVHASAR